jgi:hypothetical protein
METDSQELRVELDDRAVQELIWRALAPAEASVRMPTFNAAVRQQAELAGVADDAQLTGVSVLLEQGRVVAEITYTRPGGASRGGEGA